MKIAVDYELCEANMVCMDCCPEVFFVDDKDELHVYEDKITEALTEKLEAAVRRCPRQALELHKG